MVADLASQRIARLACLVGVLYAAISVYWGLGGTWLLDTVGGTLAEKGRARDGTVLLALWAAVVLKLIACALPLLALARRVPPSRKRYVWILAWIAGGVLTIYGLVLTVVGLLVQVGVVHASASADHRALAWHAYLWDPWFLVWGLLIVVALRRGMRTMRSREQARLRPPPLPLRP